MASFYAGNLVGHTLGSRFRLTALLGVGASARVYLAEDIKLRRRVAVKLLHASLASDEAFLRRFQREAEVLGPLSHANIVIVHDVNHRENALGEPPYLVTEYLAGGSLRNLLDTGLLLSPSQAAVVGLGAARGLQFAHTHGLVHRDIKPANLLFGDDQRVRISDFGLARALTEHARTEPEGALVGTARYLSPEQARGHNLDGRSDVYSLALVIAESMTGTVPFAADTWQGTALARLDGPIPPLEEYGELNEILANASQVDPSKRLDASALVLALEAVARNLPVADPLPLDGSIVLERAALLDERDPTLFAGSTKPSGEARPSKTPGFFDGEADDAVARDYDTAKGRRADKRDSRRTAKPDAPKRKRRFLAPVTAALVGAVAAGGIAVGVSIAQKTPTYLVPTLEGKTEKDALAEVLEEKFVVSTAPPEFSEDVPIGQIIRQTPQPGIKVPEASGLTVVISKGRAPVEVPTLATMSLGKAIEILIEKGFKPVTPPVYTASDVVPKDSIIDWSPKGPQEPGVNVSLQVSSGPALVALPKVRGLTLEAATTLLTELGVEVTSIEIYSDVKKGRVAGSTPKEAEMVKKGDAVQLSVSRGQNIVEVPNVINLSPAEAAARLRAAGFVIGNTIGPADQPVLHTRPIRRQKVRAGTKVTLYTTHDNVPEVPGITDRIPKKTVPKTTVPKSTVADTEAPIARELPATDAAPPST
jgi:eukaryotic-like serine/threonine-protein kinase